MGADGKKVAITKGREARARGGGLCTGGGRRECVGAGVERVGIIIYRKMGASRLHEMMSLASSRGLEIRKEGDALRRTGRRAVMVLHASVLSPSAEK